MSDSRSDYRNMRLLLLFDLPSTEADEKREYVIFRKALFKNGYSMIQYSVYLKSINMQVKIDQEIKKLHKYIPTNGNIRAIAITEKQYQNMVMLLGKKKTNEIYNNTERYIKI